MQFPVTEIDERIFFFFFGEFSCFRSRVLTGSVLGYDTESPGNQFLALAWKVLPSKH
jgi:hypothetical protein